jgi:hypothetical protein
MYGRLVDDVVGETALFDGCFLDIGKLNGQGVAGALLNIPTFFVVCPMVTRISVYSF